MDDEKDKKEIIICVPCEPPNIWDILESAPKLTRVIPSLIPGISKPQLATVFRMIRQDPTVNAETRTKFGLTVGEVLTLHHQQEYLYKKQYKQERRRRQKLLSDDYQ